MRWWNVRDSVSPEFQFMKRLENAGVKGAVLWWSSVLPEFGRITPITKVYFNALPMYLNIYGICGTEWYGACDERRDILYLARGVYVAWGEYDVKRSAGGLPPNAA